MKLIFATLFSLALVSVTLAQPPASTTKSRVYGSRTVYMDRSGRQIGSSRNYGRQTTYSDRGGRVISREFKSPRGSTFQRVRP